MGEQELFDLINGIRDRAERLHANLMRRHDPPGPLSTMCYLATQDTIIIKKLCESLSVIAQQFSGGKK